MEQHNKAFFFGKWDSNIGHSLYGPDGKHFNGWPRDVVEVPWAWQMLDQGFLPTQDRREEGKVYLTHIGDWTVLSFWDRSGDHRPGSNSNFILWGRLPYSAAITMAAGLFPELFKRFDFELTQHE